MGEAKITPAQRRALLDLAKGYGQHRSSTNPSLCALERRGFVKCAPVAGSILRVEWSLTDAGRTEAGR